MPGACEAERASPLPGRRPWCVSLKSPQAPVRRHGEDQRKKRHGMRTEAAGRTQCPPAPPSGAHPLPGQGCCEGRKGPVSPALHSGQHRLRGQSHEVSRWNQERAAGQRPEHWASLVSLGSKLRHPPRPSPAPRPGRMAPLSSPASRSRGLSSKVLFMCGARTKDFLLPRNHWLKRAYCSGRRGDWRPGGPSRAWPATAASLRSLLGCSRGVLSSRLSSSSSQGHPQKCSPIPSAMRTEGPRWVSVLPVVILGTGVLAAGLSHAGLQA